MSRIMGHRCRVVAGPDERLWFDEGGVVMAAWAVDVVLDDGCSRTYWFQTRSGAERFASATDDPTASGHPTR